MLIEPKAHPKRRAIPIIGHALIPIPGGVVHLLEAIQHGSAPRGLLRKGRDLRGAAVGAAAVGNFAAGWGLGVVIAGVADSVDILRGRYCCCHPR